MNPPALGIDIKELGYLVLGSSMVDSWHLFADQVLGAMPVRTPQEGLRIRLDERAARLVIQKSGDEALLGIGWLVANPPAYASAMTYAKDRGIFGREGTSNECRDRHVVDFFTVEDPGGTSHEIAWGPQLDYADPYRSNLGAVQFVTGAQGLGHIVLASKPASFHATVKFWRAHFGFSLSNLRKNALNPGQKVAEVHWYNCANSRHHTLALADFWHGQRCQHVMLQYTHLDEVGRAYDRVEKHGFRYASTLGRHINDRAVSFYIESPSGFWIELGADAPSQDQVEMLAIDDGGKGSVWGHRFLLR